jgi:hypothetical protein
MPANAGDYGNRTGMDRWNDRVLHDREIGVEVPGSVELVSPLRAVGGWRGL